MTPALNRPSDTPRWLLTGATGFLGRHVARALDCRGHVTGLTRSPARPDDVKGDLSDPASLRDALRSARPDVVIHMAGATPPASPSDFYRANTLGTLHLLDALQALDRRVRLVLVGSAAELGPVDVESLPVGEDHPAHPVEPYGLSKWLALQAAFQPRPGVDVVAARVFNPIGPGVPESQALGRFAALLARAQGKAASITVGDLTPKRDFVDARDVARGLVDLAEFGTPGRLYHIGTGQSHSVGEGLDALIRLSGLDVEVRIDPDLARRRGVADSRADISRIVAETGWTPTIPWEQSLSDLWDEMLLRLTKPGPLV